jgi:hypothetical protein
MNDVEVNDAFDDLDAAMASKKRGREAAIAEQEAIEAADQASIHQNLYEVSVALNSVSLVLPF